MSFKVVIRYSYMQDVVDFALATLREKSPVGSVGDKHPGLYRDSHTVFLNGHVVAGADVSAGRKGDQIDIANPVPYSRKIEAGRQKFSVPGHVYEDAALIVASRFGNQAAVKFTFMPVRFGDVAAFAAFSQRLRPSPVREGARGLAVPSAGRRDQGSKMADWVGAVAAMRSRFAAAFNTAPIVYQNEDPPNTIWPPSPAVP